MEEISNLDLAKEIGILNGKMDIFISLFERVEYKFIATIPLPREQFNKEVSKIKKDYEEIRELVKRYDSEVREQLKGVVDGEL